MNRCGAVVLILCVAGAPVGQAQAPASRAMTVADITQIATFGSQPHGYVPQDVDVPSIDGRLHAVVVKRGDLGQNSNLFSLLIFRTNALFAQRAADTVVAFASSSNRPAIAHLRWLGDNHTVAFLGEQPHALPQVYTIDVQTRQVVQRTHHETEITSYDITPSGDVVVYAAKPVPDTSGYAGMRQHGLAVRPGQFVGDVLMGAWTDAASEWYSTLAPRLFVWHRGAEAPVEISLPGPTYRSCDPKYLWLSPNGRVALIRCTRVRAPLAWTAYTTPSLVKLLNANFVPPEFALIDLDHRMVQPLLETPSLFRETVRWSPTGESVVIANTVMPLDSANAAERRVRVAGSGIVEVDASTHRVTTIAQRESLEVVAWEAGANVVDFVPGTYGMGALDAPRVRYRKSARGWSELRGGRPKVASLVVEEGLNLPPRLVTTDPNTGRRAVVLDPNPELATLRMGHEEVVRWRTKGGQERVGGLYVPVDFVSGRKYPLVIQTHGFDSTAFEPDGEYPTGMAAQAMVAQGMLVLQIGAGDHAAEDRADMTPDEGPLAMAEIEGAIDHLDSLGLIERSRVGLIGFSRTCYHVLYMLTHSRYPIAAAAVTDGVDFSYLQYMLIRVSARVGAGQRLDSFEGINGGPPLGRYLELWRERAPGFNLDRVTAPLRLEAIGLGEVLAEWEPFAGLLLQHKPVELFVIPAGAHLLVKPWERQASLQGNTDWFRFWLKGEEDPDPAKAEEYTRWRELRKLQEGRATGDTTTTAGGSG